MKKNTRVQDCARIGRNLEPEWFELRGKPR